MEDKKIEEKHRLWFLIVLISLFAIISVFSIFASTFNYSNNASYRSFVFAIVLLDLLLSFLIVVAESISLKIDRTATKPTLYAAICLFLMVVFSQDFIYFLSYIDVAVPDVVNKLFISLHPLFVSGFVFSLYLFFKNDYSLKSYHLLFLGVFVILTALNAVFVFTNIPMGQTIAIGLLVVSILASNFYYLGKVSSKDNSTPAIISAIMIFDAAISLLVRSLSESVVGLFGVSTLLILIIPVGFVLVYIDFLIKKVQKVYEMDDSKIENEKAVSHIMEVSCFECFDCFYDGKRVEFTGKKSKELFALLIVLKGKSLSMDKAITYLWPDKDIDKSKTLYRNTIMKLKRSFKTIGYNGVTFKRGEICLDISTIHCDFYEVVDKSKTSHNQPLMPEYDWSLEFENIL